MITVFRDSALFVSVNVIVICTSAVNVYLPKDRVTNMHQQYGFVEYRGEEDADYVSRPVSTFACILLCCLHVALPCLSALQL